MIWDDFDLHCMNLAVTEAEHCKNEKTDSVSPMVGAVVARKGRVLKSGYRGEIEAGQHAEFVVLEGKLKNQRIAGSTVYTTLEPCTSRSSHKTPCYKRLIERGVSKVMIGILDPNKDIRGKGEWELQINGIQIGRFDPKSTKRILELNRGFIDYQAGLGVKFTAPKNDERLNTKSYVVRGTCRHQPQSGERIAVFTRWNDQYWPQDSVVFTKSNEWESLVRFGVNARHRIIVARIDETIGLLVDYYMKILREKVLWVPFDMPVPPKGFEVLDQVQVDVRIDTPKK